MAIQVSPDISKDEWEGFMTTHPEANFLHSWYWGDFHHELNHQIVRNGFYKNGKLVGVLLAIVEPARRGRHLVVPGGPVIDWQDPELVDAWVTQLRLVAKDHRCLFVRVRPQLLNTAENQALFRRLGFRKSPMHVTADTTRQLDLSKTDEELRREMRKGTRYELNQAVKLGIKVEATTDQTYLKDFCDLQLETAQRQGFVPFSEKFLSRQFDVFQKAGKVVLYRASHDGNLLAYAFVIFYNQEAAYHYGASTDLARKIPGAYAIQWAAIAEARRRGCTRYNFWGVTHPENKKHRFYGVSVFKRGFGGEDVSYLPAHDLVINSLKYPFTSTFETIRRKARRL